MAKGNKDERCKTATDQPAELPKRPATAGSWKPGQSGNAKGRPPVGEALGEVFRNRFSPEWIADQAEKLATGAVSESVRMAALQMIAERTAGKAPMIVDVTPPSAPGPSIANIVDQLDDEGLRALDVVLEQAGVARPLVDGTSTEH